MFSQTNKIRLAVAGIFLITLVLAILDFPMPFQKAGINIPTFLDVPFRLGLDLQGGTHLIYKADVSQIPGSEQSQSVEGVRDVIERRVNSFGVAEPLVQTTKTADGYRVIVELAGITNVNQAISMIGETPLLEFKEANPNPQVTLTVEQKKDMDQKNAATKTQAEKILQEALKPNADFAALAKANSQDAGSKDNGGDLGFIKTGAVVKEFETVCFNQLKNGQTYSKLVQTDFGYHIIKREESTGQGVDLEVRCRHILFKTIDQTAYLNPNDSWVNTGLSGQQLKRAILEFSGQTQEPQVSLEFNDEGKELFAKITEKNLGKPVAIFLDGEPISTPTVQSVISDGKAVISGRFNLTEAKMLAQRLNAGALPVPIELISQETIGASLGSNSLAKSLQAGMLGLIAVSLFMIFWYRLPGILAVIALMFYGLLVLATFKLIPVTLTLSGISGFILSIGMAVDANILVFERLKEELKDDNILSVAIDKGFKRAWPSIYDGHISTLITCVILMTFTTSLVKGFAVTLAIGLLASLLTAMVITKSIMRLTIQAKIFNNNWLFGVKKK